MTSPVVTYDVVNRPIPWNMHRNADIAESWPGSLVLCIL